MTVIPKNTRTDKYYITINSNDKQKCDSMTPQYANSNAQVCTPPYLTIQSYRMINYHVTTNKLRHTGGQRSKPKSL